MDVHSISFLLGPLLRGPKNVWWDDIMCYLEFEISRFVVFKKRFEVGLMGLYSYPIGFWINARKHNFCCNCVGWL